MSKSRIPERTVGSFERSQPDVNPDHALDLEQEEHDLLMIMGVLLHKAGINAVAPSHEALVELMDSIHAFGDDIEEEVVITILKKAQMEVLQRQLAGKV